MSTRTTVALLVALGFSGIISAQDITYDIDLIGGTGSFSYDVTGFIMTDGTLGTVNAPDIVSWSLQGQAGTSAAIALSSADGDTLTGGGLDATPQYLYTTASTNLSSSVLVPPSGADEFVIEPGAILVSGPSPDSNGVASFPADTVLATAAPEIDPASAIGGLTLLLCALAVLRGRRPGTGSEGAMP